jgi:dipeptide transport system ATP-binding protein
MTGEVVLTATDLARHYSVSRGGLRGSATLKAVDGVSFELRRGETLAVVGESGCGKSTLARMVTMIEPPTRGSLRIQGAEVVGASSATLAKLRPAVQMVFQDCYSSLNPRQKIGSTLEEPLLVNTSMSKDERRAKAETMMKAVGLRPEHYNRYPHMFSGGQRQRIAIARALMLDPAILVLDEPVSALDLSVRAQVLNLITELQKRLDLAYLFISHDLSVVRHIADDVMVMYLGRPVEQGSSETLFSDPRHPYTRALLSATPVADPARRKERIVLKGELPSPLDPPPGCTFNPRCPLAFDRCVVERPELLPVAGRVAACHACQPAEASPSSIIRTPAGVP